MFSVYRNHLATAPLRQAWEKADEALRQAILLASSRIDRLLQSDPHEQGESRDGKARILFEGPVAVLFEVDDARKLVSIRRTWAYPVQAWKRESLD